MDLQHCSLLTFRLLVIGILAVPSRNGVAGAKSVDINNLKGYN
jgi:hypothetical protein